DHEAQRKAEELQHGGGRDAPVDDQVEVIEQHVHLENERHDAKTEQEWNQVLPEDVSREDAHGRAAYPTHAQPGTLRPHNALTVPRSADTVAPLSQAHRMRGLRNP